MFFNHKNNYKPAQKKLPRVWHHTRHKNSAPKKKKLRRGIVWRDDGGALQNRQDPSKKFAKQTVRRLHTLTFLSRQKGKAEEEEALQKYQQRAYH